MTWTATSLPHHRTLQSGHVSASRAQTPFTAVSWKTDIRLMHPASPPALSSNPGLDTHRAHALKFPNFVFPNTRMREGGVRCGLTAKVAVPWIWLWAVTANLSLAKQPLASTPDSTLLFIPRLYYSQPNDVRQRLKNPRFAHIPPTSPTTPTNSPKN